MLGNEIQRVRMVFKYAFDADLIDKPVRCGPTFKRPSKRVLRKGFSREGAEDAGSKGDPQSNRDRGTQMKAMILLGVNAGFGNHDSLHSRSKPWTSSRGTRDFRVRKRESNTAVPYGRKRWLP